MLATTILTDFCYNDSEKGQFDLSTRCRFLVIEEEVNFLICSDQIRNCKVIVSEWLFRIYNLNSD